MKNKTDKLFSIGQQAGLKISRIKTKVMTINMPATTPVQLDKQDLCSTDKFTYLGSIVSIDGGAQKDIKSWLKKAGNAFRSMKTVWKSSQYTVNTKIKLYKTCILSEYLYRPEFWRTTKQATNRLPAFHTRSLQSILKIYWPDTISNNDLLSGCHHEDMATIIMRKRWRWNGHVLGREEGSIVRTSLYWTPEGKRKRGRPKSTWRRTVEAELKEMKHTQDTITKLVQNRNEWKLFVTALCVNRRNRHLQ